MHINIRLISFPRHDVQQGDIAPLMAALLNLFVPVNSVGSLPWQLLGGGRAYQAEAMRANAWQVLEHYRVCFASFFA